jgi:hypothetical protein
MIIALVIGSPVVVFLLMVGWFAFHWVGVIGAALLCGGVGAMMAASDDTTSQRDIEERRRADRREQELRQFIPEVRAAVSILLDDDMASRAWAKCKLGKAIETDATGRRTGEWPRVMRIWATSYGAQALLDIEQGQSLSQFTARAEEIADTFFLERVEIRRSSPGVLRIDLIAVQQAASAPPLWDKVIAALDNHGLVAAANQLGSSEALATWIRLGLGVDEKSNLPAQWPQIVPLDGDPGIRKTSVGVEARCWIPTGHDIDSFRGRVSKIAPAFGVWKAMVNKADHPSCVLLHLINVDVLVDPIPQPWPPQEELDLRAVPLGMLEDATEWRIPLLGAHYLVVGTSGSGKSSLIWAVLVALGPAIRDGWVQIHAIDLKDGMELGPGGPLFTSWVYQVFEALEMLERLVDDVMSKRSHAYRVHAETTNRPMRKHAAATPQEPHHIIIIDEILSLLKLPGKQTVPMIDDETGKEANVRIVEVAALRLVALLSKARAVGVTVIGTTQDPTKAVMDMVRDLFTAIIGMRLASNSQERIVFGSDCRERGVRCAEIGLDQGGMLYVLGENGGPAQRARVFEVTDDQIENLVKTYRPRGKKRSTTKPDDETDEISWSTNGNGAGEVLNLESIRQAKGEARGGARGEKVECAALDCNNVFQRGGGVGRKRWYCSQKCRQRAHERRQRVEADRGGD